MVDIPPGGSDIGVSGTVQALETADYVEGATADNFYADNHIVTWTTATGAASLDAALAAVHGGGSGLTDTDSIVFTFYNSTSTNVETWYVPDVDKDGNGGTQGYLLASFTDLAASAIAATFNPATFEFVTI